MDKAEGLVPERRARRWRSVDEKRRIVELTLVAGASVALVARAHGVNANQVFKWRREFERGELPAAISAPASFLPVVLSGADKPQRIFHEKSSHIHLPRHAVLTAVGPCVSSAKTYQNSWSASRPATR